MTVVLVTSPMLLCEMQKW